MARARPAPATHQALCEPGLPACSFLGPPSGGGRGGEGSEATAGQRPPGTLWFLHSVSAKAVPGACDERSTSISVSATVFKNKELCLPGNNFLTLSPAGKPMKSVLVVALLVIFQVRSVPSSTPLSPSPPLPSPRFWWSSWALAGRKRTQTLTPSPFVKLTVAPLHLLGDPREHLLHLNDNMREISHHPFSTHFPYPHARDREVSPD